MTTLEQMLLALTITGWSMFFIALGISWYRINHAWKLIDQLQRVNNELLIFCKCMMKE